MKLLRLLALFMLISVCHSAKILAVLALPGKSHAILIEPLLRTLSKKGHAVTFLTTFEPSEPMDNVTIVHIPGLFEEIERTQGVQNTMNLLDTSPFRILSDMPKMGLFVCNFTLHSDQVQNLIVDNKCFDLIIADDYLQESIIAGFAHKCQASIIGLHSTLPNMWSNFLVGNPAPSSYLPEAFLGFETKMTFIQRVYNFMYTTILEMNHRFIYLKDQDKLMRQYFGNDLPPLKEIIQNTSLVLVNHHFSITHPHPLQPSMIEVAGMHISEPKPLPLDLQTFMNNSKHGVILFSLGSNIKSSDLPSVKQREILSALSRLTLDVLWKYEGEISNLPKNVKVMKWIPQNDVLAHPNLKLFITHGGMLSTTEAAYYGIPVIGVPFFGDQPLNTKYSEKTGVGKMITLKEITEETLYNAIIKVLFNNENKVRAAEKSKLLRDMPMPPLDSAVWWVEYVLRHKGAKHLRSPAQDLYWHQYYQLDVLAFIGAIFIITAALPVFIYKCIRFSLKKGNDVENKVILKEEKID